MSDGERYALLPAARDHKRLGEHDTGPNTGGMGAYSPLAELDEAGMARIGETIILPVLRTMAERGAPFRGALFCGLMLTATGPRVLEFNVRLGDPETQAILPRLDLPLHELLLDCATGTLPPHRSAAGRRPRPRWRFAWPPRATRTRPAAAIPSRASTAARAVRRAGLRRRRRGAPRRRPASRPAAGC